MKLQLSYPLNLPFHISQKFGENLNPLYVKLGMKGHNGYDLVAKDGTPVYAAHDGEVTYAGLDGSNGVLVVIKTNEQYDYQEGQSYFKTMYGHLKTGSIKVTVTQKVRKGEQIAEADNTGASTGSHLHWGLKPIAKGEQDWIWWNVEQENGYNGAIDPTPYMDHTYPSDYEEDTPFLNMQKAILLFQLSEGLKDFQGKDLRKVRFGPKTLLKAIKYYK